MYANINISSGRGLFECLFFKTHLNIDIDIAKMKRPFLKSDLNIDIEYSKKKVHISISILVWFPKNPILILACFFFWAKTQYQYWVVAFLEKYWYWEFDKQQVVIDADLNFRTPLKIYRGLTMLLRVKRIRTGKPLTPS